MSLYSGINPCDATINVMTVSNESIELPIRSLSELRDYDISPEKNTLIYVNSYYTTKSYFSISEHLKLLQERRRDFNIILVDFAKDIQHLYHAVRHHVNIHGYFVAKIIKSLVASGIKASSISLIGHSVGANVAALSADYYNEYIQDVNGLKIGQLIAIDPAIMCNSSDFHVRPNITQRVIVLHGEGNVFGVREPCGNIDIYPNGIGYFPRRKNQPGCDTALCSHLYPFIIFMESMIEGVKIPAVQCDSWLNFRQQQCNYNDIVTIGVSYPETANGVYFCITQKSPPYTFMEHGLRYIKKTDEQYVKK